MIEILLTDLNKENFYEETLKKIESICDDYAMDDQFGLWPIRWCVTIWSLSHRS